METKSESIHYRVTPKYKRYLELLASQGGYTVSQYITHLIRLNMDIYVKQKAAEGALASAILDTDFPQFKIPQNLPPIVYSPEHVKHLLNEDEYNVLLNSFNKFYPKLVEKLKNEFDFNDDGIIPQMLLGRK
jgi:uncharacterized protein YaaW (UPF0174 family)